MSRIGPIQIQITQSGAQQTANAINNIGTAAINSQRNLFILKSALSDIEVTELITKAVELADSYALLNNRLLFVEGSQTQANVAFAKLAGIADRSRTSIEETVDTYAKFIVATNGLGFSHEETARAVQTLNEAIVLSGVNTRQSTSAVFQLAEGLSQNSLQGRQLLAVLKQLPAVADIIAEHLGITRGELKAFGTEGKLNAQTVVDALVEGGARIDAQFQKTPETISQAIVVIKNRLLEFVAGLEQSDHFIRVITGSLDLLSTHIAGVVSIAVGVTLVIALQSALVYLKLLQTALGSLAFTPLVTGVIAATIALGVYAATAKVSSDESVTAIDVLVEAYSLLTVSTNRATAEAYSLRKPLEDNSVSLLNLRGALAVAGSVLDRFRDGWNNLAYWGVIAVEAIGDAISTVLVAAINLAIDGINLLIEGFQKAYNLAARIPSLGLTPTSTTPNTIPEIKGGTKTFATNVWSVLQGDLEKGAPAFETWWSDLLTDSFNGADNKALKAMLNAAQALADFNAKTNKKDATQAESAAFDAQISKINEEINAYSKLGLATKAQRDYQQAVDTINRAAGKSGDVTITPDQSALLKAAEEKKAFAQEEYETTRKLLGVQVDLADKITVVNDLIKTGGDATGAYARELGKLVAQQDAFNNSITGGLKTGVQELLNDVNDTNGQISKVVVSTFGSMQDALNKFILTGKINFHDLVSSIASDMLKLTENKAIATLFGNGTSGSSGLLGALLASFGGASQAAGASNGAAEGGAAALGAFGEGSAGIAALADGGPAYPGHTYVVGERHPELFTPNVGGYVSPNMPQGGSQPEVHVHVHNYNDPKELQQMLASPNNDAHIVNAVRRNRGVLNKVLA